MENSKNKPTESGYKLCVTRGLRKLLSHPGFVLEPQLSMCLAPAELI